MNSGHPGRIDNSNTTCDTRKCVSPALGKIDFVQKSLSISKTVYIIGRAFIHLSCHDVIRPILSCSLLSWCNCEAIGQQKENVIPKIQILTQTLRELLISEAYASAILPYPTHHIFLVAVRIHCSNWRHTTLVSIYFVEGVLVFNITGR
jgi:hypothetical protein